MQVLQTLLVSQTEQWAQAEEDKQFVQAFRVVEAGEHAQVEELVRLGQIVYFEEVEQVLNAAGAAEIVGALENETALHAMAPLRLSMLADPECMCMEETWVWMFDQTLVAVRMIWA